VRRRALACPAPSLLGWRAAGGEFGFQAAKLLLEAAGPPGDRVFPADLVVRASTAPPARGLSQGRPPR
jgi:DNA-binding LacI/PurR family transcriptional regulator